MRSQHAMPPDATICGETRIRGVNNSSTPKATPPHIPNPAHSPTLTVDAVAKLLHVSRASAYRAVHAGEIPSIRVGHRLLVPTAALLALLGMDGGRLPAVGAQGGEDSQSAKQEGGH